MLKDKITRDMQVALKEKDKLKLSSLRMLLAEIKQKEIDQRVVLSDEEIISLLTKMVKQRQESQRIYIEAKRPDLAEKEAEEVLVLKAYLPEQLDEVAIKEKIQQVITTLQVENKSGMSLVMSRLKKDLAGQANMSVVSQIVKEILK